MMRQQERAPESPLRLRVIEDRLLLLCLPVVLLVLIVWALGIAFGGIWLVSTLAGLVVTVATALIALVLLLRYADLVYHFVQADQNEEAAFASFMGLALAGLIIAVIASASHIAVQHYLLFFLELVLLAWQVRRILLVLR